MGSEMCIRDRNFASVSSMTKMLSATIMQVAVSSVKVGLKVKPVSYTHLTLHYPAGTRLIAADPDLALQTRLRDRFYDHYVMEPMQKIVTDKLRPAGANDPHGVAQAKAMLLTAYGMIEAEMATRSWAVGDPFSMADCAAAPSLFYANLVLPLADAHPVAAAYLNRLMARPSFARVVQEAQPYFALFPG